MSICPYAYFFCPGIVVKCTPFSKNRIAKDCIYGLVFNGSVNEAFLFLYVQIQEAGLD